LSPGSFGRKRRWIKKKGEINCEDSESPNLKLEVIAEVKKRS
jgi:hypothetical protein